MPQNTQADALRGTIDLLVLNALLAGPLHGWGIGERIQQISRGVLEVNQGSLYPALQRLEHRGAITSEWGMSDNNRRARYYRLTAAGRKALGAETESWRRFAAAVETALAAAGA
jgi:PadR family transcriptional regulator PadR